MNQLCVVNYIYGEKYQGFIPLYIISLKESYPEYHVRLYIDSTLTKEIRESVDILSEYYNGITVIENYAQHTKFSKKAITIQQIQRCQRWLFYDEAFLDYEAIYIGDIDLLICREEKPLLAQHKLHCQTVGAPYSNISRAAGKRKLTPKMIARNVVKFGLGQSFKYYFGKNEPVIKLSGLHFVLAKEYYEKVNTVIDGFYNELNLLAEGKSKRYNLCSFNNEAMLRDLVMDAGFNDCELATGLPYNIETDASKAAYRPHHGIHLGIFRSRAIMDVETDIITSDLYKSYYKQFCNIKTTEAYKRVSCKFSEHVNNLISVMEEYYSNI